MSKNWEVVHDRVVDNITPKLAKVVFNLTENLKASKNVEKSPPDNKTFGNKLKNTSRVSHSKWEYALLGEPLDVVYKTLLQKKLIYPFDNSHPYDPQPQPPWWNETTFCKYQQNKGHKTSNCINLHHKFQYLINNGDIVVDGHNKNIDHKDFKDPFLSYEKGENSKQKN